MTKIWTIGILALGLSVSLGCSRDEASDAMSAAGDKAEQAMKGAAAAGEMAAEAAEDAGETAEEAVEGAAAAVSAGPDMAARCTAAAAAKDWQAALAPCTAAHEQNPDDMAIEHALQQAQAAAAE